MDFDQIYLHSKNLLSRYGKSDKSSYVSDRKILWIGKQPLLTKYGEIAGHHDSYTKAIASELMPDRSYILLAGGNTEIGMHRDASYAAPDAISLNLGGWHIGNMRMRLNGYVMAMSLHLIASSCMAS